jgi:hypothetical protein
VSGEFNDTPIEDVSQKEQPSPNAETEVKDETQPKQDEQDTKGEQAQKEEALTLEKVQKMIADATTEAVAQAKDAGRRELQSQQDKNKAEMARAERRAKSAEAALKATQKTLEELDPDAASKVEIARYKAQEQEQSLTEQQEETIKAQQAFHQQFQNNLTQFVTSLGIDPKNEKIDWAEDAKNYLEAQQRVLKSVADIQSETLKGYKDLEKRLKDSDKKKAEEEKKEINSVDTATSAAEIARMSDNDFYKKFGSGELPYTKENKERADKIAKSRQ